MSVLKIEISDITADSLLGFLKELNQVKQSCAGQAIAEIEELQEELSSDLNKTLKSLQGDRNFWEQMLGTDKAPSQVQDIAQKFFDIRDEEGVIPPSHIWLIVPWENNNGRRYLTKFTIEQGQNRWFLKDVDIDS